MQVVRYAIAGVVNTGLGYGVFWLLLKLVGVNAEIANAVGYCVGLISAFVLNRVFVFGVSSATLTMVFRFFVAFMIAYIINLLVLVGLYRFLGVSAEIAQIFAMAIYTLSFYILNKTYVFNQLHNVSAKSEN
ncbi:GtrA family protein [Pseudomonas sp. xss_2]|uniref:GtrA family protein n=1 Tax=Pseudomonas sp. xss_2 TaxID=3367215 RepID=UPI00370B7D72